MPSYDQRFKVFLTTFLDRFLLTFWPEVTPRLRLSTLRFLPLDLYADPPTGEVRAVDVLAEVETTDGEEDLILLHVDVQAQVQPEFPARMWDYFCLLTLRHRKRVLPIALLLYPPTSDEERVPWGSYQIVVAGEEIARFRYRQIALRALPADEYLPGVAAVGAALALLMQHEPRWRRPELYVASIRHILAARERGEITPAETWLLGEMLTAYGDLSEDEREAARQVAEGQVDGREIMATEQGWFSTQMAEAERRGLEHGREEGQKELIREIALVRFGAVPPGLERRLTEATGAESLRSLARLVASVAEPAELE